MTTPTDRDARPGAFSLVELVVLIAIVALIIAISLPTLGAAMRSSREARSLANARSIAQIFEQYASANETYPHNWRGEMPPRTIEDVGYEVPWYPPGWVAASSQYWTLGTRWPGLVADPVTFASNLDVWRSPGHNGPLPEAPTGPTLPDEDAASFVSYVYSNSFIGDPSLWKADTPFDWTLARAVRPSEVESPSAKVMLWDRHLGWARSVEQREGHNDAPTPMAFADGHAESRDPLDASPGVPNVLNDGRDTRLHNTPGGVRGRDF